jgi:hypothetical protein
MTTPVRERLERRLVPCPDIDCECLLWTGHLDESGYGRISVDRRSRGVHRVAWEMENGPIPAGLQIDHVRDRGCRHRNCANVAHLEPVTQRTNIMRGDGIAPQRKAQTHCVHGHEFTPANTMLRANGNRGCLECRRRISREWARRKRASATT